MFWVWKKRYENGEREEEDSAIVVVMKMEIYSCITLYKWVFWYFLDPHPVVRFEIFQKIAGWIFPEKKIAGWIRQERSSAEKDSNLFFVTGRLVPKQENF